MHHEEAGTGTHTASAAHNGGEVGARPQPVLCRKHSARAQADSSERPLRRRAARIARPARVLIRSRKPWVFARRRLLGWNVRLLTLISPVGRWRAAH